MGNSTSTTATGEWTEGPPASFFDAFLTTFRFTIHVYTKVSDPKVDDFFLINPIPVILLCLLYICSVNYLIPLAMEHRKPLNIQKLLIFYNFSMVLMNTALHYEFWMAGWGTGYNFFCENIDYDINPKTMRMANLMWWYYISKYIDMFDTVFIVLRKQQHKITFLHFFHHFSMPGNVWVLLRFFPGGHCTFHGLLNSFVHIVMYLYYGIAAIGPEYRKYLWWKKYVTLIQLIQFYLDGIHLMLPFFVECDFPKLVLAYMLSQTSVFLVLFTDFYVRTYVSSRNKNVQNGHIKIN